MAGRRRSQSVSLLALSIVLCASLNFLPWPTSSFPLTSLNPDDLLLPSSDFVSAASPSLPISSSSESGATATAAESLRVKRAHQAYMRYLRARKMRQADEKELRQKLASKIVPPAATTPGSLLSRLPLPRMPPINRTAIMMRIPPKVLTNLNATAMNVMQSIPPQVMGALVAARQALPAYIEQIRGPVNQAVMTATMMGQRLIGGAREGYRMAKSGDLMANVAGMLGMGGPPGPPPRAPAKGPPPAAAAPSGLAAVMSAIPEPVMQLVANARQMAGGLMSRVMAEPPPGAEPNRMQVLVQQVMAAIQSNPNLRNIMAKVMRMMPSPEPVQRGKK